MTSRCPGSYPWFPRCRCLRVVWVLGVILLLVTVGACSRPDRVESFPEELWEIVKREHEERRQRWREKFGEKFDLGPVDRVVAWAKWKQYHLVVARGRNVRFVLRLEEQPDGTVRVTGTRGGTWPLGPGDIISWSVGRLGGNGPAIVVAYVARHVHTVEVLFRGRTIRKETAGRSAVIIFLEDEPSPPDEPLVVTEVRALNAKGELLEKQRGVLRRAP